MQCAMCVCVRERALSCDPLRVGRGRIFEDEREGEFYSILFAHADVLPGSIPYQVSYFSG